MVYGWRTHAENGVAEERGVEEYGAYLGIFWFLGFE